MIDWSTLTTLIGPRWRNRDLYARERLGVAKQRQRGGRHQPKKHSVADERAAARRRREVVVKAAIRRAEAEIAYHDAVRAYWAGERDNHP